MLFAAYRIENVTVNYSKCSHLATSDFDQIPSKFVSYHFRRSTSSYDGFREPRWKLEDSQCVIEYDVPNDIASPIFLYYQLTNFYQNHRQYVKSYDVAQLHGEAVSYDDVDSDCDPLSRSDGRVIYPCGLIANSLFNDTFTNPVLLNPSDGNSNETYVLSNKDISWSSDRRTYKRTQYNASQIVPPPNWQASYPDGYTEDNIPDLSQDEFFQNWMRTAALPSFMKLAAKNTTSTLKSGSYQISLGLNYPVEVFGGSKSIVLTTNSVIGGRHMGLGVCYLIVAGLSLLFCVLFGFKQLFKPRKIGDHNFLTQEENHLADLGSERRDGFREVL